MQPTILVINPGATSTKTAVFRGTKRVFESNREHTGKTLSRYASIIDQLPCRERAVRRELVSNGMHPGSVDVFMSRGGLLRPLRGGVYVVGKKMLEDLRAARYGEHACNLGALIAARLAADSGKPAYIADPVIVDELEPRARITGHPDCPRRSVFHALSQKAVARRVARKLNIPYRSARFIVAHVGSGISVGVHRGGRVVDCPNALDGEGPFTPERTGGLPLLEFYRYVVAHGLGEDDVRRLITRRGGLFAHLGTNDCREIERRIAAGDARAKEVFDGFSYQVGKAIGAAAAALAGDVDAVILTGNVLFSRRFRTRLTRQVRFIAGVHVLPGSFEMEALAAAGMDVYTGRRRALPYP